MGSRIAILHLGKLQQVGTPLEVYEKPRNVFVANFIGTPQMNFVRAKVRDGALQAQGFALPAPETARAALSSRSGQEVLVGIRPENVLAKGRPTRGATAPLELTVELVETLGNEVVVHARQGDDLISFKMDPHTPPELGSRIQALVELDKLHLFDAGTEQRIAD